MKKYSLNVLRYGYLPLNYWKNWFKNIEQFFRNIKYASQRITKGFCDWDTFDMDIYYAMLIHDSLVDFADNIMGWPDTIYDTPEDYQKDLYRVADLFKNYYDEESKMQMKHDRSWNHYQNIVKQFGENNSKHEKEISSSRDEWLKDSLAVEEFKGESIKKGLSELSTLFRHLWS